MTLRIRCLAVAPALLASACAAVEAAPAPAYTPTYTMPSNNSSVQLPSWAEAIPTSADLMRAYPVNVRVGNVRNNDAALIEPVALAS